MADTEETPSQRQARIRREKREAKITANASERLEKITRLSGRVPEPVRSESPPTPPIVSPQAWQINTASPGANAQPTPEQMRAQEEYLRAMLRQPTPQEGPGQAQQEEDPMMKMLQTMMGSMGGADGAFDPNAAGGMGSIPGFSPDDISKATGIPSFVTNMFMGSQKAPPTKAELQTTRVWKIVHVLFAILAGVYLVFTINKATETFGRNPPAPATFQNPFMIFLTGEVLVQSARVMTNSRSGKSGIGLWVQMGKEFVGDGAIMVFMLGLACWMKGMV